MLVFLKFFVGADDGFGKKRPSEESHGGERTKRAHVDSSEKPYAIKASCFLPDGLQSKHKIT